MTLSISTATVLTAATLAAGGTTANSTAIDGSAVVALGIYAQMTFNDLATSGAVVRVGAGIDATHVGLVYEHDVEVRIGGPVPVAFSVLPGHKAYVVTVKNLDPAQAITGINIFAEPQVLS